jgi:NAD(P)-dependent dehydrogenase (short-subunit alcohol dehydrogenase family)
VTMLDGKRVLVVGASSGVGRAFAARAVADGAEVVAEAGGGFPVVGDVSDPDSCSDIVDRAVARLGSLDLLFYAAGYASLRPLVDTASEEWRKVFETNVLGVQRVLAAAVPHTNRGGIAAVLSSETVGRPRHGLGAYSSSKAALEESLRAWRLEHPEMRFSCVALGATQPTEFGDGFDPEILGPVVERWFRHGLMQREYMATVEVAELLADLLGSALRFPGVGIEELVLRSPSPIVALP